MNRQKIGFYALAIGMIILIIGLIYFMNKKDEATANPAGNAVATEPTEFEKEVEEHTEYIQDVDKDPFNEITEEKGDITIDSLPLAYSYLKGTHYDNTAATLIGATEHYLIYHNYNDVLTFYDGRAEKKYTLDKFFNKALITPNEEFIIYTKNAFNKEAFYYVDLKTLQTKEFHIHNHSSRMKIKDMKYHDELIYFLIEETETGKTSVHFTATPSSKEKYTTMQRDSVIQIDTDELYQFEHGIYAFNKKTNSIEQITPANPTVPVITIESQTVKKIRSLDFYNGDNLVVTLQNDKDEYVLITPKKTITTFDGLMSAHWFDENHLLINDDLTLYLYNLKTDAQEVVKAGISDVFPTRSTMTIQTNEGTILKLEKQ